MTELERLQRIAADIRHFTDDKQPEVQLGIGDVKAANLLARHGATEAVYEYGDRPPIRALTLEIEGVVFTAQMDVKK